MSGKKGRSGKSKVEVAHARQVFRSVIPEKRWRKIIDNLAQVAEDKQSQSAMEAFRLLAPYVSGVPTESNSGEENVEPFNLIEYVLPGAGKSE